MVFQGKTADYEGFGKDVKKGLSKAQLLKKYGIKTDTAYRTYRYRARALGLLEKGELSGKPLKPSEPLTPSQPKKPKVVKSKPKRPNEPFQPSKPFEPSEPKGQDKLKVHWELPRELIASIRYRATLDGKAVIDLVREALEKHIKRA